MHIFVKLAVVTFLLGVVLVSSGPVGKQGKDLRLIKYSDDFPAKWMTESEIHELIAKDQGFFDITERKHFPDKPIPVKKVKGGIPMSMRYQETVREAMKSMNRRRMKNFLDFFTTFHNRYQDAYTGVGSSRWLRIQIRNMIADSDYPGANESITLKTWVHEEWMQDSIIVRIEGSDPDLREETVILGAHQDSINIQNGSDYVNQRAPGADDNASGCITVLEVLTCLLANKVVPRRSIEFHWYAAEERGLLGSTEIAEKYRLDGINVVGMINYDVVGYFVPGNEEVAVITDYVDDELTEFLRLLIDEYLIYKKIERPCGYACSDHAAWTRQGFPAARPTQAVRNGQMHTEFDTVETVSLAQIAEFVKIGLGFAIEIAEPATREETTTLA